MVIRIDYEKIRNLIFCDLPLFLLGFNYILYNSLGLDSAKNVIRIVALTILFLGWLFEARKKLTIIETTFAVVCIFQLLINGSQAVNLFALVGFSICATRSIEEEKIQMFKISLLLVVLMMVFMLMGVVSNTEYVSTMGRARATMGFINPNVAALFYSSAVYLFVLSRKKISILTTIEVAAMAAAIFFFTNCRTSVIALSLFAFFLLLIVFREKGWNFKIENICIIIVDSLFVLNFLSVFFTSKLMRFDVATSFRITTFQNMINDAGIKGLILGGTTKTADSFYYMMLFSFGAITYILFAVFVHQAMNRLKEQKRLTEIAFLVAVFVYGIMESSIIRPELLSMLLVWKIVIKGSYQEETIVEGQS